ncbi:MAG: hypothetical protein QM499_09025 [Flavobacteriaceae bacterium]
MKKIFKAYINSSIHVAIAVCAFLVVNALEFSILISNDLLGFVFFGTITAYNFVKYAEVIRTRFKELWGYLKIVQIISLLALIYFTLQLSFETLLITGGFAMLTFFYAIPFLKNKNLRNFTGLKITIVAVVWAGVTVLVPLVNEGVNLEFNVWISFVQRFLFVFVLTLPFEIRDLQFDELALGTLPQRVGVRKTNTIGIILLSVLLMLEFLKPIKNFEFEISLVVSVIVLGLFLLYSKRSQSKYYASFWVESIPILWLLTLYLFQNYFDISF